MLTAALEFAKWGCSVVPAKMDGSKAPLSTWKKHQSEPASADQLRQWFTDGQTGLGVITGAVSGNLEMLELEQRAVDAGLLDEAREIAINSGLSAIWEVMVNGYSEMSAGGGIHWLYRIPELPEGMKMPGNMKIASRVGDNGKPDVLVETRGEGGFCITAPSYGSVHPSGNPWAILRGSPEFIPTLSWDEREALHAIFRSLDSMPSSESSSEPAITKIASLDGTVKPGDDYCARVSWDEILIPIGWKKLFTSKGVTYWRRPGKDVGMSATTGRNEADNLFVFTTSTQFEAEKPYSKFAAFTLLEFGSHSSEAFRLAASHLRFRGYGSISGVRDFQGSELHPTPPLELKPIPPKELSPDPDFLIDPSKNLTSEIAYPSREEQEFEFQLKQARITREVRRQLDAEEALTHYDKISYVSSLEEELLLPEEETPWTISNIFPRGANVTLTAPYKAGKTTLITNLARSLVDGDSFLNYFKPAEHSGQVVIFNYEVNENQYRRWIRDVAVQNSRKITIVHRRGMATPLISEHVRKDIIEQLKRLECETWIVDPFHRAFTASGDENSNSDVGVFVDLLDIIKEKAGVSNLILPIHTGRAQENGIDRARGATRIDDWADVRWLLKKTDDGRFFSADGRDVLLEEQLLRYDNATRHLTLGGSDARTTKIMNLQDQWVDAVTKNEGRTTSDICTFLKKGTDDKGLIKARKSALNTRLVKTSRIGSATIWHLFSTVLSSEQTFDAA